MYPEADVTRLNPASTAPVAWRGFGRVEDLDIRFDRRDRPALVSAVLAAAAPEGTGAAQIWSLSLAERLGGLLTVWGKGTGQDGLELVLTCPAAACGSELEVALPLEALLDLAEDARAQPLHEAGSVKLRRPTGEDQRRWRAAPAPVDEAAILADLVIAGTVAALEDPSEVLAAFDPLTCFSIETTCPDCGAEHLIPTDLEAHLLALLAQEQARLFREVDVLARRYGWLDSDILGMPVQRRRRYLQMIEAEAGL